MIRIVLTSSLLWLSAPVQAHGVPDVLLIYDTLDQDSSTSRFFSLLESRGVHMVWSEVEESRYDGTNPPLDDFQAVLHLNASSDGVAMPLAGQVALRDFVHAGGGYLHTEWVSQEHQQGPLGELVLFQAGERRQGTLNLTPVPSQVDHPVLAGTDAFTLDAAFSHTTVRVGSDRPTATPLLDTQLGGHGLAVAELGAGRLIGLSLAGNSQPGAPLLDANILRLVEHAIYWASSCDDDGDGDFARWCGGLDCDDTEPSVFWRADELCDGVDNDCDEVVDEAGASDAPYWFQDADQDGFGWPYVVLGGCEQPSGFVADDQDCDDRSDQVNPLAEELCDGVDNDCDGLTDPGCTPWYRDADADGFGDALRVTYEEVAPAGHVADATDCDDGDPTRWPGAPERPYDGVDQDCDGQDLCDLDDDGVDAGACGGGDCDDEDAMIGDTCDESGCGCSQLRARGAPGLLLMATLLALRRRRSAPR